MAGYFDQCACGEYTCVGGTPCRQCLEAENKRLRQRINMMLKCLDGGMDEEEKYNQQQLLHEIKVIAKGEWKGGGSDEE